MKTLVDLYLNENQEEFHDLYRVAIVECNGENLITSRIPQVDELKFACSIAVHHDMLDDELLWNLWRVFNLNRPEWYKHRYPGLGDVMVLDKNRAYVMGFCGVRSGFIQVTPAPLLEKCLPQCIHELAF